MYFTEQFWMETWISTAITAGTTLLGVIITVVVGHFTTINKAKQIIEKLPDEYGKLSDEHDRLSGEHNKLSGEHNKLHHKLSNKYDKLSNEHNKLSDEHNKLSKEHIRLIDKCNEMTKELSDEHDNLYDTIMERHSNLTEKLYVQKELLNKIVANQEKEEAIKQTMPKETELSSMVKEVYNRNAALMESNTLLTERYNLINNENMILKDKITDMEKKIFSLENQLKEEIYKNNISNSKVRYTKEDEYEL